jgi:hypothetical protein
MRVFRALRFGVVAVMLTAPASADAGDLVAGGLPPSREASADHRSLGEGGQASDRSARPAIAPKEDLKNLTLVKSDAGKAVVRFGTGALQLLSVGDRVGRNAAVVRSVEPGRLVLDEIAPGADGRPQASQIVWRDGETGGTRFRRQPADPAPAGVRPRAAEPASPATDPATRPGTAR